ncbi:MAG: DEAD/DEAH box helicase family protein [Faecalibacterium sp.]
MYQDILQFRGTWRSYQARVLARFYDYKSDGRVHIVAAPGSGKTTLGIELICLMDEPCIVLVPSITIREQWIARIEEAFLQAGVQSADVLSQNLKEMKLITVATYQGMHSAMVQYKGQLRDEIDEDTTLQEEVDYEAFDLVAALSAHKIKTICLDECHHLRSEWWKSLEKLQKNTALTYTIALTATPPYDSTPEMWSRYMRVCGEIDEEITVPELVKDGNLCPHQDYVYFNYPTQKELKKINDFKTRRDDYCDFLLQDDTFEHIILSHACLQEGADFDALLENPAYLSSILIYLNTKKHAVPPNVKKLLGYTHLEKISPKWFELLLQGVLYDDCASYAASEETLQVYRQDLKARGLIEQRRVALQLKNSLKKELVRSVGKCESIKTITFHEYKTLREELRLLILCDYIKKEYKPAVGNEKKDVHALGAVPFFELLRRENQAQKENLQLGVLCGTIAIIPARAQARLLEIVANPEAISYKPIGALSSGTYLEVDVKGDRHFLTAAITQLFKEGYIQALIGTKALLGEGWDSPCVNALILASFVGSFMLSNQMRGRAIRTYAKNPDKASNIWHLVCAVPKKFNQDEGAVGAEQDDENGDMEMLARRMEHFLGLHYTIDSIENGIRRLSVIHYPVDDKSNLKKTNCDMLALSAKRDVLKARWDKAICAVDEIQVIEQVSVESARTTVVSIFDYLRYLTLWSVTIALIVSVARPMYAISPEFFCVLMGVISILIVEGVFRCKKLITFASPFRRLKAFGEGMRKALLEANHLEGYEHRVEVQSESVIYNLYLVGGSGYDKALFAQCMDEMFSDIDNQRYILYAPRRKHRMDGYFAIPRIFTKRKEDAVCFANVMRRYIGKYEVVYTRNPEGRKILLKGRKHALANRQNRALRKKKVKSALE